MKRKTFNFKKQTNNRQQKSNNQEVQSKIFGILLNKNQCQFFAKNQCKYGSKCHFKHHQYFEILKYNQKYKNVYVQKSNEMEQMDQVNTNVIENGDQYKFDIIIAQHKTINLCELKELITQNQNQNGKYQVELWLKGSSQQQIKAIQDTKQSISKSKLNSNLNFENINYSCFSQQSKIKVHDPNNANQQFVISSQNQHSNYSHQNQIVNSDTDSQQYLIKEIEKLNKSTEILAKQILNIQLEWKTITEQNVTNKALDKGKQSLEWSQNSTTNTHSDISNRVVNNNSANLLQMQIIKQELQNNVASTNFKIDDGSKQTIIKENSLSNIVNQAIAPTQSGNGKGLQQESTPKPINKLIYEVPANQQTSKQISSNELNNTSQQGVAQKKNTASSLPPRSDKLNLQKPQQTKMNEENNIKNNSIISDTVKNDNQYFCGCNSNKKGFKSLESLRSHIHSVHNKVVPSGTSHELKFNSDASNLSNKSGKKENQEQLSEKEGMKIMMERKQSEQSKKKRQSSLSKSRQRQSEVENEQEKLNSANNVSETFKNDQYSQGYSIEDEPQQKQIFNQRLNHFQNQTDLEMKQHSDQFQSSKSTYTVEQSVFTVYGADNQAGGGIVYAKSVENIDQFQEHEVTVESNQIHEQEQDYATNEQNE